MRLAYPILLLVLLVLVAFTWLSTNALSDPQLEAVAFIEDVRDGDIVKAVRQFGSNACRCPAKGGWVSYLIYKSGQEQNLAFILGHPFQFGTPQDSPIQNHKEAVLPWQKPEDFAVDVPITFSKSKYMPYFLPLKMAYGQDMSEAEFKEFLADPDKDAWKGFTLRLRSDVQKGVVAPPTVTVPHDLVTQFAALTGENLAPRSPEEDAVNTTSDITTEDIKKTLGQQATEYLIPKDAGRVLTTGKEPLSFEQIRVKLPRLKKTQLRLHIVRRGKLNKWTVYHFGFMYPELLLSNGRTLKLEHDQRPN